MAIAGIACLTIAMAGILTLISGELFGWITGAIIAALAIAFFGGLWFGLGLSRRRTLNHR
jgi:predicted Na+-dependent transporter